MKSFISEWEKITSDPQILDIVEHCHIEFVGDMCPQQRFSLGRTHFNLKEIIDYEIYTNLLPNGIIKQIEYDKDVFLSPIFIRPKKNGEFRIILNLKRLNEDVVYHHFKMNSFERVVSLVKNGIFMASVDLRHAYYSVHIAEEHQKYLCFKWGDKIFQYTCLPNGLASAPRLFTKLLKPVFAKLRSLGYVNIGYIDDSLLFGDSKETVGLMENLGFIIHKDKSVFKPSKQITFLGNIIDSENMLVILPKEKRYLIKKECENLSLKTRTSIREVARVIGLLVSRFSAVDYGKLFYRNLERTKIEALKNFRGNFDAFMHITSEMKLDLFWWIENIYAQVRIIARGNPDITMQTDASICWGAVLKVRKHVVAGQSLRQRNTLIT